MSDFASIVRSAASKARLNPSTTLLQENWDVLVGSELASKTTPIASDAGCVTISIPISWKEQTKEISRRVKRDLSALFPSVKEVVCVLEERRFPEGSDRPLAVDEAMETEADDDSFEARLKRVEDLMLNRKHEKM